jgi:hypothetical protein
MIAARSYRTSGATPSLMWKLPMTPRFMRDQKPSIGFSLMTEHGALILHAIVAPIAFAGLSWVYRMFLYMAS